MKTTPLFVGLLAAATVGAAERRKPDDVVREWNLSVVQSTQPLPRDLRLRAQADQASPAPGAGAPGDPTRARLTSGFADPMPRLREPLLDAPCYRIPAVLPDHLPLDVDLRCIDWRTGTSREK